MYDLIRPLICRQSVPDEGVRWGARWSTVWTCKATYEPAITSQWVITPLSTQEWSTGSCSPSTVLCQCTAGARKPAINFSMITGASFSLLLVSPSLLLCHLSAWHPHYHINTHSTDSCDRHMHDLKHLCIWTTLGRVPVQVNQWLLTRAGVVQIYHWDNLRYIHSFYSSASKNIHRSVVSGCTQ